MPRYAPFHPARVYLDYRIGRGYIHARSASLAGGESTVRAVAARDSLATEVRRARRRPQLMLRRKAILNSSLQEV